MKITFFALFLVLSLSAQAGRYIDHFEVLKCTSSSVQFNLDENYYDVANVSLGLLSVPYTIFSHSYVEGQKTPNIDGKFRGLRKDFTKLVLNNKNTLQRRESYIVELKGDLVKTATKLATVEGIAYKYVEFFTVYPSYTFSPEIPVKCKVKVVLNQPYPQM